MKQNLNINQSQSLTMTPQLQQAIKLLQMNNIELEQYVEEELEKNPLLEKIEPSTEDNAPSPTAETPDSMDTNFHASNTNDDRDLSDFDAGSSNAQIGSGGNLKFEEAENTFENRISETKTLRQHLEDQLLISCEDSKDQLIGRLLIDQLDETGYLRCNHEDLAKRLGCSVARIERLLQTLKGFEPTGIFAADLAECLALQLEEKGTFDTPMKALIKNLPMLGNHDFSGLAKICGVNDTYLKDMIAEIKALNPKPAAKFDHLVVQTAIPDVLMKRLPTHLGGGWRVEINTNTLPNILVNQEYYTTVKQGSAKKEDREYIATQLQNANWLVRAMDQRAQTILKVANEIIEQQEGFFNFGIEFLRPLKLSDIAKEIEMHESTVSRVTTGKFIGTPRGIFELKYFFSTALISASGVSHSSSSIKARIKTLTEEEDPKKILSDDKLVTILKAEGIDLARRTVAKYREAMNIGSSVQRRKEKKNRI